MICIVAVDAAWGSIFCFAQADEYTIVIRLYVFSDMYWQFPHHEYEAWSAAVRLTTLFHDLIFFVSLGSTQALHDTWN